MAGLEITPIVRAQDFTIMKHNEDIKASVDQVNIGHVTQQKETEKAQNVVNTNQSEFYNKQPDARQKGSNEYNGDGGRRRQQGRPQDKVVVKGKPQSFDFKI